MSQDTKTIKTKMATVGNLKKITKAMEMVARGKMKKAVHNAVSARSYARFALELLVNLSGDKENGSPFLVSPKGGERNLFLHIASNKGLCGGYNASLLRSIAISLKGEEKSNVDIVAVGKYAARHGDKTGVSVIKRFDNISEDINIGEIEELCDFVINNFLSGRYKKVFVSYANFVSAFKQDPVVRQLLPVSRESLTETIEKAGGEEDNIVLNTKRDLNIGNKSVYLFEPSEADVLNLVVPRLVRSQIYQSLLEAGASEQSARMVAMKNANESANKMSKELLLSYNKARQAGITKEILEIAAGADAVAG